MLREVVITEAVRSPVGKRNGALRHIHPVELAAHSLRALISRSQLDPASIEDIVMGCVSPIDEQGYNIGRLASLEAGFPTTVPAVSINRMCGSGQQATHFAVQAIASGDMEIAIGAGVESMTRVPIGSDGNERTIPTSLHKKYPFVHQGVSAEMIAEKWGFNRQDVDAYAYQSHQRALAAIEAGHFEREIAPLYGQDSNENKFLFTTDEGPRADTSLQKLSTLRTVFKEDGVITAGNASQISDGSAAVLFMSREKATQLGCRPRARIISQAVVGSDPTMMLDGVIPSTRKALQKAGLTLADMDRIEINEAFAPVVLAWQKELQADMSKVNVNGGAIALGHPLGATGAKLITTLLHELERIQGRYGLLTICIGHGMSTASIIERLD
ncbi:thiolase family protein [Mechercharimyces sp. CAU 1602]|uniref:thiolase family protein n=1 Tax=Mechercharimyces sp. CAU 1602 TaxID=2973933 RepID=UPI0021628CA8|nr:thiolase family protein [Mechercharimyces sp. CAU 1602]MCS1351745.1 thiolase family protein [Mechercharimyces sp. CAU 1602]